MFGVAVVGLGYWGPRLVRNFAEHPKTELLWVCDTSATRFSDVRLPSGTRQTSDIQEILADSAVDLVAVATPASTHFALASAALRAGKHVLVEKPLAVSTDEAALLGELASAVERNLVCDHTYCFTPAARWIADFVAKGGLGDLQWFDSVRVNLGLVQVDVDVLADLAPHDLSLLDLFFPSDPVVATLAAVADPLEVGKPCLAHLNLRLASGATGHVHVNWLSPTKIRRMVLAGSDSVVVWDDLSHAQRVSVYDSGVDVRSLDDPSAIEKLHVSYRSGSVFSPLLEEREAIAIMIDALTGLLEGTEDFPASYASGLRIMRVLDAAAASHANGGWQVVS